MVTINGAFRLIADPGDNYAELVGKWDYYVRTVLLNIAAQNSINANELDALTIYAKERFLTIADNNNALLDLYYELIRRGCLTVATINCGSEEHPDRGELFFFDRDLFCRVKLQTFRCSVLPSDNDVEGFISALYADPLWDLEFVEY